MHDGAGSPDLRHHHHVRASLAPTRPLSCVLHPHAPLTLALDAHRSHCSPHSVVVQPGVSLAGDCVVNVDASVDPSSTLGGCGGHGMDHGYCEVDGLTVRACFHDRCWGVNQAVCGEYGATSSVDAWMDVTCEISDAPTMAESDWETFQTFGPSAITQISGENSLLSNGWVLDGINDWASCDGAEQGPISRCACGCNANGVGEYAGFWAGSEATGIMDLPLPDGTSMVQLTIGMHYENPVCRGVVSLGHAGENAANGRPSFHTIYDNLSLGDQQSLVFSYEPGDILRIAEYETCIVHLCE